MSGMEEKLPKLWTPNFIFISLVGLCNAMAFQGLNVSLPVYIDELGGSAGLAGLAMATLTAAAVLARPFVGLALDKYGRKLIFVGGLLLFLLPSITYIFIVPFWALLMLRFVQGLGWGVTHTTASTVASDIVPPLRLGEGMGTYNVTGSISFALAPLMSLWLINQFSFRTLFVVISLLSVTALILSQVIKYPSQAQFSQERKVELFSKEALRPAVLVLLIAISHSSVLSFLALFAREKGITNPGVFFVFMGLATFFSRPLAGRLLDRLGRRGFDLAVGTAVPMLAIALCSVAFIGAPWQLAVSGTIFGLGSGTIQSSMLTMTIKLLPGKHGSANAIYGTFLDTGVATGSLLWGVVAGLVGYQLMFGLTTVPVFLCLAVYFIGRPERQTATDHQLNLKD